MLFPWQNQNLSAWAEHCEFDLNTTSSQAVKKKKNSINEVNTNGVQSVLFTICFMLNVRSVHIMVHCTFRSRCAMLSEWRWAMAIVTCRTMAAASEKASGKHLNKLYTISTFNLQQFVVLRTLMLWLILSCSMKSPINLHFVTPTSLGKRRITPLLNSLKQLSTSHATRKQLFSVKMQIRRLSRSNPLTSYAYVNFPFTWATLYFKIATISPWDDSHAYVYN